MKSTPTALKSHFASQYQTVARCWRVTLKDGTVLGFTDHDQSLTIGEGSPALDVTYLASAGYTASNVVSTSALDVDNLELQGMLVSPSILDDDLRAGVWDYAAFEIFEVNWADLSQGRSYQRVGKLGEISTGRSSFTAELRGLAYALNTKTIGELTSPSCRAMLGDDRCRVDLYPLTETGTVDSVHADNMTWFDSERTEDGPAGGYDIIGWTPSNPIFISVQLTDPSSFLLTNGAPVAISEVIAPHGGLNGIWTARNVQVGTTTAGFSVDFDGTIGAWSSGGVATPLGNDSGYWDFGVVTFTTGLNAGISVEIKQSMPGQITNVVPMPYAIQAGDEYRMTPGCDKQLLTCKNKYNNVVNMRAEPYLAGIDKMLQIGRR